MPGEKKCPTCDSPSPELHPAVQHEGEVEICKDAWHLQETPQNRRRSPMAHADPLSLPQAREKLKEVRAKWRAMGESEHSASVSSWQGDQDSVSRAKAYAAKMDSEAWAIIDDLLVAASSPQPRLEQARKLFQLSVRALLTEVAKGHDGQIEAELAERCADELVSIATTRHVAPPSPERS